MIKNLIPSYWKLFLCFLKLKTMSAMAKRRFKVCESCQFKNTDIGYRTCELKGCPCPLIAIVQEESEKCPLDKWQ